MVPNRTLSTTLDPDAGYSRSGNVSLHFLLPERSNFVEFLRQANMQWAFPTHFVEHRFGLCQRVTGDFFFMKENAPCIHHVTFVQYAPLISSSQRYRNPQVRFSTEDSIMRVINVQNDNEKIAGPALMQDYMTSTPK